MATNCRSCGELIEFRRTVGGKLNPISVKMGASHFIDCPQRREWRKAEPEQTSFLPDDEAPDPRPRPYYDA